MEEQKNVDCGAALAKMGIQVSNGIHNSYDADKSENPAETNWKLCK